MAAALAVIALVLTVARDRWAALPGGGVPGPRRTPPGNADEAGGRVRRGVLAGVAFTAVETGVESAAGIWGYLFLTSGRGLPTAVAGGTVSAYWVMMFVGRAAGGPVAERAGASVVLAAAVAGIPLGAALRTLPAPGFAAVAGMLLLGLAAAPVFPLLTLTTADRLGGSGATAVVGLQVAASAVGSATLPSGVGLVIGAVSARALAAGLLPLDDVGERSLLRRLAVGVGDGHRDLRLVLGGAH